MVVNFAPKQSTETGLLSALYYCKVSRLKKLTSLFWTTPFIAFLAGYFGTSFLFFNQKLKTPFLIGKNSAQAAAQLSSLNLNMRIINYVEDPDLPADTVIDQTPSPGQVVRPGHHLFLALSSVPPIPKAPSLLGASLADTKKQNHWIKIKSFSICHPAPQSTIISQLPQPGEALIDQALQVYTSSGPENLVIVPSFKNIPLKEVASFLTHHEYAHEIFHQKEPHAMPCNCIVILQKPLAGSLISRTAPPTFQITAAPP